MVRLSTALIFLFLTAASFNHAIAGPPAYMQVRIFYDTDEQYQELLSFHPDIVFKDSGFVEVVTFSHELEEIITAGFRTEIIHEDLTAFYQSRLDSSRDMGGYKTLSEVYAALDEIIADHSDIVSAKVDIGLSLESRTMWAVKVSDNPEIDEDEPEILYTAAIHAREVITPEVLLYFMNHLTDNYGSDAEATYLVDNREMWFILVVNPDGYYHNEVIAPGGGGMWRKNRRNNGDGTYGVDLNRNWGYKWGYNDGGSSPDGSSEVYRGTGPFSEPESQNVSNFIAAHEFVIVVDYHSYTNLILWPWGYNSSATPDEAIFRALGDSMHVYNGYTPGILGGINGCTSDWEYGEQTVKNKCYAFLFEVGNSDDGFWPELYRIPQLVSENLQPNLILAQFADDVERIFPPGTPLISLEDTVLSTSYQVKWYLDDSHNSPDVFELREYLFQKGITDPCNTLEGYENVDFEVSTEQYYSEPGSFASGAFNNTVRYFQLLEPIKIHEGDQLQFRTYYDIQERYDYAYVEVGDGGENFVPIPGNITTNYNPNGLNRGNGITGTSGGWIQALFDLSDYAGQEIYTRFSYYTNTSITGEGFFVDDIYPSNNFTAETLISSTITDTFYTFSDKPTGKYYYKVRARDTEEQWSDFSDLKATLVRLPFICGDADGDEAVNILDVVFTINYIYKSGAAPQPVESANVNNDEFVNILDVVYLINFLYKGGPEPNCP